MAVTVSSHTMCLGTGENLELTGEIAPPSGVASYHPALLSQGSLANRGVLASSQHPLVLYTHPAWTAK